MKKMVQDVGDVAGGVVTLGLWAELVPTVLGVLGIAWFVLRFVNFIRTNLCKKKSWKGLGE
jgi:hypothetical protein